MSRFDLLKSLVRGAAKATRDRLGSLEGVAGARELVSELRARRTTIREATLTRAIGHGVEAASVVAVSLKDGRAVVEVEFTNGEVLVIGVVPQDARFAPRGAKEVIFAVDPPEAVNDRRARQIVGACAAAIARALWGPMLGPQPAGEHALVDREGARLRADLRTVPSVRAALEGSALGLALDVITIESFEIADRGLGIIIALPFPGG